MPSWDDVYVGAGPEPREYGPLTRTDFVRYQGASGDFNPIHHDEEFAKAAGYPTVFSVGMLQAGILAGFATDCLETLEEIAMECRDTFLEAGGKEFHYIPTTNDTPAWMTAISIIALENLQGWTPPPRPKPEF